MPDELLRNSDPVGELTIERLRLVVGGLAGNPWEEYGKLRVPGNGVLDPVAEAVTWYQDVPLFDRELRFEGQSDAEARTEMSSSMPTEYVDAC